MKSKSSIYNKSGSPLTICIGLFLIALWMGFSFQNPAQANHRDPLSATADHQDEENREINMANGTADTANPYIFIICNTGSGEFVATTEAADETDKGVNKNNACNKKESDNNSILNLSEFQKDNQLVRI